MLSIGIALITKNAATHLGECLEAVSWADQIVVLDCGSYDATLAIAARYHAEIHTTSDWPGFGIQKNRCMALITTDWIFALDADEIVTPELAAEIRTVLVQPNADVYAIPRLSNYCGQWMHHSGWYPDYVPRLFRYGSARYSDDLVHEKLLFHGNAVRLQAHLLHYSFDNLDQVLDKINRYSRAGAEQHFINGRQAGLSTAIIHGLWAFVRSYLFQRGFLDGREGFILAVSNAEGVYYRYLKLMYLTKQRKL